MHYIRLPLANSLNTRDLGGYAAKEGSVTKFGVFLRSDDISELTEGDKSFLYDYGVRMVIDLRSDDEIEQNPGLLCLDERFSFHHVPILPNNYADNMKGLLDNYFLGDLYSAILDKGQERICKIFKLMASQDTGAVLFHCTLGKDRTGVVAALILLLAGVEQIDVIANYEVTNTYVKSIFDKVRAFAPDIPPALFESRSEYINVMLQYLTSNYQSIENFMLKIGVTDEEINKIVCRFTATNSSKQ